MLSVEKNTEDAVKRGGRRPSVKNDHRNYIIDHGKIMEKSWNFVFEFLWEPCIIIIIIIIIIVFIYIGLHI